MSLFAFLDWMFNSLLLYPWIGPLEGQSEKETEVGDRDRWRGMIGRERRGGATRRLVSCSRKWSTTQLNQPIFTTTVELFHRLRKRVSKFGLTCGRDSNISHSSSGNCIGLTNLLILLLILSLILYCWFSSSCRWNLDGIDLVANP